MDDEEKTDKTTMKTRDEIQMILIRTGEAASQKSNQVIRESRLRLLPQFMLERVTQKDSGLFIPLRGMQVLKTFGHRCRSVVRIRILRDIDVG